MPIVLKDNVGSRGQFNEYLIAGNRCNAFAIGEIGSPDDFFLIGAEPPDESSYPLLTGNILDSEGKLLFKLVRNVLVINPGNCSKIVGDHIGYEIHESAGNKVFAVRTEFKDEMFVTTISANLYDKSGKLVFSADDNQITTSAPAVFGYGPGGRFGTVVMMSDEKLAVARIALESGGKIHEVITGTILNQKINLDGKALIGARLDGCDVLVRTADFLLQNTTIENCRIGFEGRANQLYKLILDLTDPKKNPNFFPKRAEKRDASP